MAATLDVQLSNVSVSSGSTYNSQAAVCSVNQASPLAISADVSPGFTVGGSTAATFGKCSNNKSGGDTQTATYTETTVSGQTVTVTAKDDNSNVAALSGGPTYTGDLSPLAANLASDGKYGVTVSASASENVCVQEHSVTRTWTSEDGSCSGSSSDNDVISKNADCKTTTSNSGNDSDTDHFYYVDLAAPTVSHNVTNPLQEVMQNTDLNVNIHVSGGSSEQNFNIRAGFNDGSNDIWGPETPPAPDSFQFGKSLTDGVAGNKVEAAAVLVSCSVPVGTPYVSKAQLTATTDLCGNAYAPPPIDSTAQGKSGASGLFAVTENPDCAALTNQAVVTAPLPPANLLDDPGSSASSYALAQCFTSKNAGSTRKPKIVSYPGTVHLGTVLNSTGDGSCTETVAVDDVMFALDADFDFLKTGNSPQAHVFVGTADDSTGWPIDEGPGFWYHTGYPLVEVDPSLIDIHVSGNLQELTIALGDTELGCGPGLLPKGKTLYARAHAKFVGTPTPNEVHTFQTSAAGVDSSVQIIENPLDGITSQPVCVDGQLPPPPP